MISSTITAISPTRRLLPFSPFSIGSLFFSVFTQAAFAHLEGIIDDPHGHLREDDDDDDESKTNGTPEGGQFSDGDEAR